MPYLRDFGTTRFLSNATPRKAQQAAVAAGLIAFMEAMKVDKAIVDVDKMWVALMWAD